MAIKGKSRTRSRRVVAVPPRPPVYVRTPPLWRRKVTWLVVAVLVLGGALSGIMLSLSAKHRADLKQTTLAAIQQFESQLSAKFPPSPDSRPAPPTGYVIYPTLSTDLTDVASGKLPAAKAESKGKSLADSAKASAEAIQALPVTVIPEEADYGPVPSVRGKGASRLEITAARNLIVHAFRVYQSIGSLMRQAGQASDKDVRKALIDDAKALLSQAQGLFNDGYQKITNLRSQLETISPNPFPAGPAGGLGG